MASVAGASPIVVLIGTSTQQVAREFGELPLALQSFHGKALIDHWCVMGQQSSVGVPEVASSL
jgi:hypothetical protein